MSGAEFRSAWLNDPRLTAHALSPTPVWLWSTDATGMLWGNPTAAAIFDAASPGALALLRFEPTHVSAAQIARLSGTLPHGGAPRLERLRGFGASFGGTLVCLCSRIVLPDNSSAILVVSTERAGKDLSMPERAHRLLADFAKPAAIFSADGELIDATPAAGERMGSNRDLIALGAQGLAGEASRNGRADGEIAAGPIGVHRLGAGGTVALLVTFETVPSGSHAGARASDAAAAIAASTAPNRASAQSGARKLPYRFLWQMDADTRFTQGIEEFAGLIGSYPAVLNRPWANIADALKLDNQGEIARALAARETWSGIVTHWPVDGSNERLPIEMSGLPVFDRDRQFEGFRGFAICRDAERLAEVNRAGVPASNEPPVNVLAFRAPLPVEPAPVPAVEPPSALTPGEHSAFEELARELNARLKKSIGQDTASVTPDDFDVEPAPFVEAAPPAPPPPEPPKAARNGDSNEARPILDRLPIGILVYRLNNLVYANRSFLDWTGYPTLEALT